MISLIVLPIICYLYLIPYTKQERSLEIAFCQNYNPNRQYEHVRFDTTLLSIPENRRVYQTITLNGIQKEDNIRLAYFRLLIRELYHNHDTITGVHLIYGDSITYGTYIESFNICKQESILIYAPYRNNLWVYYKNLKWTPHPFCGNE